MILAWVRPFNDKLVFICEFPFIRSRFRDSYLLDCQSKDKGAN